MGSKKCRNKKNDWDQFNESKIQEENKERMWQRRTTFKEPKEETTGQALMDPTPIESYTDNFLASLLKY